MGHASRLVLVIKQLQALGAEIAIACTPEQKTFFEQEVQVQLYFSLGSYNISYPNKQQNLAWHMAKQLPHIRRAIKQERAA
ncbi:MAG: hypothetical protein RL660_1781, partial [Bacteroidota bacterium]